MKVNSGFLISVVMLVEWLGYGLANLG